jgi:type VI secretion system protein VasG
VEEIASSKTEQKALTERWLKEKAAVDKVLALRRQLEGGSNPKRGETIKREKEAKKDPAALSKELDAALAELKEIQGKDALMHLEVSAEVIAKVISDGRASPSGIKATRLPTCQERRPRGRISARDHVLEVIGKGIRAAKGPEGSSTRELPRSGVGKTAQRLAPTSCSAGSGRRSQHVRVPGEAYCVAAHRVAAATSATARARPDRGRAPKCTRPCCSTRWRTRR